MVGLMQFGCVSENGQDDDLPTMVGDIEEIAISSQIESDGELSAAIVLRRLFPGIRDNAQALYCARIIAGWKPLPLLVVHRRTP